MREKILAPVRRRRQKRIFLRLGLLAAVIAAFLVAFFSSPLFIESLRISDIKIQGTNFLSEKEIKNEAENILAQKMFGFIPRNNVIFAPEENLKNFLTEKFKRIKSISIDTTLPSLLIIALTEREAEAILCFGSHGECYFVDGEGLAFEEAPFFSAGVYLRFFDETGASVEVDYRIDDFLVEKARGLEADIKNIFEVEGVYIKNDGICEVGLPAEAGGTRLILDANDNWETVAENFILVFDSLLKGKMDEVEYIDLRFGNKVYYK